MAVAGLGGAGYFSVIFSVTMGAERLLSGKRPVGHRAQFVVLEVPRRSRGNESLGKQIRYRWRGGWMCSGGRWGEGEDKLADEREG